jgi:hypothetical protein
MTSRQKLLQRLGDHEEMVSPVGAAYSRTRSTNRTGSLTVNTGRGCGVVTGPPAALDIPAGLALRAPETVSQQPGRVRHRDPEASSATAAFDRAAY